MVKRGNLSATYGNWTLHMFRHTFATSHLRSGVDIRTLMKWSGHEDLATVQQYLDWLNAHSDEARLAVNRTFATTFVPPLALAPVQQCSSEADASEPRSDDPVSQRSKVNSIPEQSTSC